SRVLREVVAAQAGEVRRRLYRMVLGTVLLAGVLLIGLVFLLLGAYQSLAELLPTWQAGGLVALGALLICLLLLLLAGLNRRYRVSRRGPQRRDTEPNQAAEIGASVGKMLSQYQFSGSEIGIAAFVIGLLVSRARTRDRSADSD
ncbi:MAG: hypothetical protein PVF57_07370, partial [Pseudomonadales bacterium]